MCVMLLSRLRRNSFYPCERNARTVNGIGEVGLPAILTTNKQGHAQIPG